MRHRGAGEKHEAAGGQYGGGWLKLWRRIAKPARWPLPAGGSSIGSSVAGESWLRRQTAAAHRRQRGSANGWRKRVSRRISAVARRGQWRLISRWRNGLAARMPGG